VTARSVLPYGDGAVLIELDDPHLVLPMRDALIAQRNPALRSIVPAARTVLVEFDPTVLTPEQVRSLIPASDAFASQPASNASLIEIAVRYDGQDLQPVADEIGESVESVVARHLAAEYTVQFCGFSPGFSYLIGLDPALQLPRLDSPRPSVPAGSVAIAGEFAGIYPRSSPGGWRLLGSTDAVLFDVERNPPALLTPGTRVRFVRP
jgi:5-oxoprolinase (ATP-hydrolysing) subunit B